MSVRLCNHVTIPLQQQLYPQLYNLCQVGNLSSKAYLPSLVTTIICFSSINVRSVLSDPASLLSFSLN